MDINLDLYPIDQIREEFPALQRIQGNYFVGYFDGPSSTQIAKSVIDSMATYMRTGVANPGGVHQVTRETSVILDNAREYAALFLGAEKENIAFGPNMSILASQIAQNIAKNIKSTNGNIVITEFNRRSNVKPWKRLAEDIGVTLNVLEYDPEINTLIEDQIAEQINEQTKIVVIGIASNVFGTLSNIEAIIKQARKVNAYVIVDGSFSLPHMQIDFIKLDVDVLFCSAYKFFGPHVGIIALKSNLQSLLGKANDQTISREIEIGAMNIEGIIGVTEAIRFIASIGEGNLLQDQLISAYKKIQAYENFLADRLRNGLAEIEGVVIYQAATEVPKIPIITFQLTGMEGKMVCYHLANNYALYLEFGDFEADLIMNKLTVNSEQLVRAGIAPYNTVEEVDRLIDGIQHITENYVIET